MCGIAVIVAPRSTGTAEAIDRMICAQAHRGPNGKRAWHSSVGACDIALGHNRLAIIDPSAAADQPMAARDGRAHIIFNGEVYNYIELGAELRAEGVSFETRSDTEVIQKALLRWGVGALSRFNGMWAIALLDVDRQRLLLARDRLGVKPIYRYYDESRRAWYFASEIKTILQGVGGRFRPNAMVLDRYLEQQQLDAQRETCFVGIESLPPGSWVEMDLSVAPPRTLDSKIFWSLPADPRPVTSDRALVEEVRSLVHDAVRLRLRSDVPVGLLLSGGLDSSVLAAAATQVLGGGGSLHTIGAVSGEGAYSEERQMDLVARHLGVNLHKVRMEGDPGALFSEVDRATQANDEPIGGLANVAHLKLMDQARDLGITVLLTGQGADELTCGYLKYLAFHVRQLVAIGHPVKAMRQVMEFARNGTVLRQFTLADARRYLPPSLRPARTDVRGPALRDASRPLELGLAGGGVTDRQALDLTRFSIPALLHYEDRMSMAAGREMRPPFLDYRLVELLQPLSVGYKLRDGWTKWILRAAFSDALPRDIAWRKDKQGFTTPEGLWVVRELRPAIDSMVAEPWLTADWGLVDRIAVQRRMGEYQRRWGTPNQMRAQDILGPILMERWARAFSAHLSA
ncbi:MAG TPA: asparagine synthase (glutamine-hydrolyzing) [Bryobacteraceae bacterium]|nr:asparagine synthase (glutamine-hydrolyzing) [Bryobacteraceae bacterium]